MANGAPPPVPPGAAPAPEQAGPSMEEIVQGVSAGLSALAQAIGSQIPEAGQALDSLNDQFTQIIGQLGGGGAPAPEGMPADPQAGAAPAAPAGPQV